MQNAGDDVKPFSRTLIYQTYHPWSSRHALAQSALIRIFTSITGGRRKFCEGLHVSDEGRELCDVRAGPGV